MAVEAELGHVGQAALGEQTDDSCYTRPEDVTEFLNQTRADCLAIACGTAHGQYPKGVTPEIRFDIIRAVKKVTDVPIALHGGSGSGDENIKKAVEAGTTKLMSAQRYLTMSAMKSGRRWSRHLRLTC